MDLAISNLKNGLHELEVLIFDSTSFDRRNYIYVSSIKWTINSSISSSLSEIISTREQNNQIVGISSEISYSKLKTYPNPLQKTLKIEYEITNDSPVEFSIVNLEGEHIETILNEKQIQGAYKFEIDVSNYSIGLYLLIYKSGSFHQSIRLVKID